MSTNTPETSVDAGKQPEPDRAGEFSLDVEERSIPDAVRDWVNRSAPVTRVHCHRSSDSSSSP